MYQKFGFEIVGRRPKYYQDTNEDAVLMTLNNLGEGYLTWMDNLGI
jgi:ribosomal protein S18 acetylase RimI-like enzyme